MVITILEAKVKPDKAEILERAFRAEEGKLPPGIVDTFLLRAVDVESIYQIVFIWESRQALEKMRADVEKPKGVQIFETAGVTPGLAIKEVVVHFKAS